MAATAGAQGETSGATCCGGNPGGGGGGVDGDTAGGTHLYKSKQLAGRRGAISSGQQTLSPRTDGESSRKVSGILDGRRALADEPARRRVALPCPPEEDDGAADQSPRPISTAGA